MIAKFRDTIKNIPQKPGVYRYYTEDGLLLYVGKAKRLKARVSSYFQEGRPRNQRLTLMVNQIDRIEYTVVQTEKESLILEANLIHNLQPKYNVLLKSDGSYVYVRVTDDPIPGIFITRRKYDPHSHYFGPYTKRSGIANTLRTIRTIFPYCQERFPQKKACNYYAIKQCNGICVGHEYIGEYKQRISLIEQVLKGKTTPVNDYLMQKIQEAVEIGNFELAGLWRDRLHQLQETIVDQKIVLPQPMDLDVISLVIDQEDSEGFQIASSFVQNIREGRMVNVGNFLLTGTAQENFEFEYAMRFLQNYYSENQPDSPVFLNVYVKKNEEIKRIYLSGEETLFLAEFIDGKVVQKNTFKINTKKITKLSKQGLENAIVYLERNRLGQRLSIFEENNLFKTIVELQKSLGLKNIPRRTECYDISHLSGKFVYGSMVVFIDGRPSKKNYRLFKTKEQNNDFENHKEVLRRRFERCLKWLKEHEGDNTKNPWKLPNLIIVDGGKGQLSSDLEIVEEYRLVFEENGYDFPVELSALAKKDEEIFLPDRFDSVVLAGDQKFLIQRIRDEAHRFAITNNRKARLKTAQKSELDDIPGIGPKTKQKLLQHFGSVKEVGDAIFKNQELVYELIGESSTKKLKNHFGVI